MPTTSRYVPFLFLTIVLTLAMDGRSGLTRDAPEASVTETGYGSDRAGESHPPAVGVLSGGGATIDLFGQAVAAPSQASPAPV